MANHGNRSAQFCTCLHRKTKHERNNDKLYAGPCREILKIELGTGAVTHCGCAQYEARKT